MVDWPSRQQKLIRIIAYMVAKNTQLIIQILYHICIIQLDVKMNKINEKHIRDVYFAI